MVTASVTNRIGFLILGLTNNFAYVVMLAAAFDLLKNAGGMKASSNHLSGANNSSGRYCNQQSTSTVLLADTIPSLVIKLSYPFLLVSLAVNLKVLAVAILSALSFIVVGLAQSEIYIFSGIVCASLSSGLGESVLLSNTPFYGDSALSGWSMGTGAAGLLGAVAYAILRLLLTTKLIMLIMLVIPIGMLIAYFGIITPVDLVQETSVHTDETAGSQTAISDSHEEQPIQDNNVREYGALGSSAGQNSISSSQIDSSAQPTDSNGLSFSQKIRYLPKLAGYFIPLLLVYFSEYFINQGLFELIYYPEVEQLDHATQYSWFQVSYQLGVLVSRSSLDLFKIRQLSAMAALQALNLVIFLAHAALLIHIPSFSIVILLIVYEGLLGGFTYTNTYHRLRSELPPDRREFGIGCVTVADTMGIVAAGLIAMPVHDSLCKLYD